MNEEWRAVSGWPYEVSSHGRVRAIRRRQVMTPRPHTNGYARVTLCDGNGKRQDAYIHTLVAEAFIGPRPGMEWEVDHVNNVRDDNTLINIRWLRRKDNRARRRIRFGQQHANAKLTDSHVREIRGSSIIRDKDFATQFGVSRETVRDVRLGKAWKHVG